jgi:hydroxyethylthiazole kinase-like uncharacterized protein yjeF
MIPVSSAAECRELDRRVIEGLGVSGFALMELASRAVADATRRRRGPHDHVLVVTGAGNNGGDGWGAARWLHGWGVPVAVWPVVAPATPDARRMADAARRAGVPVVDQPTDATWVIDALVGTGLRRPVEGVLAAAVVALQERPTIAVDLPTGLCADTGRALGALWPCAATVTFGRPKLGMYAGHGPEACGDVEVVDLCFGAATRPTELRSAGLVEANDLRWPKRQRRDHKRSVGHVVLVAGSAAMAGAAVLCAQGALAAGAGLVTLVACRGVWPRLGALPPEVMVRDAGPGDVLTTLDLSLLGGATAVVAGPGLGGGAPLSTSLADSLRTLWAASTLPLLFDADALACVSSAPASSARVLTPHAGEAARVLGWSAVQVEDDRFAAADALAAYGSALLKGPFTLVVDSSGRTINPTGGPTLATGGSGDVLAGVIGALLAGGLAGGAAARLGAWVHGRAGDQLAARRPNGWTASDIVDQVPWAAAELTSPDI